STKASITAAPRSRAATASSAPQAGAASTAEARIKITTPARRHAAIPDAGDTPRIGVVSIVPRAGCEDMTGVSPCGPRAASRQDTSNSEQIHVSGLTPPLVPGCAEGPNRLAAPGGAGFRARPIRATFDPIKTAPVREPR